MRLFSSVFILRQRFLRNFNIAFFWHKKESIAKNKDMKKILLYLSAFVPLYFLVTIKILIDIIFGNLHFNVLNTLSLILLVTAIVLGIVGAKIALKHAQTPTTKITIKNKQSITEQYFLGYFSLFVLFALSFELERVSMFVVFVIVIVLIGIVYIKNDLFYINPFLNILGYNFYEVEFSFTPCTETQKAKFAIKGKLDIDLQNTKLVKLSHENFSLIVSDNEK